MAERRWIRGRPGRLLPLFVLLLGMSTVFFFVGDRGHFYRNAWNPSDHFHWTSSQHLTIAVNLSHSHNFLGFESQSADIDGNIVYSDAYNRFPPIGYVLIKLVTLPFGDDLSNRIYAAQMLMLIFFVGTAVLAHLTLCRLTSHRWIASAATLMVFSSTPFLHFNDMILTELMPDIFGFALTFHGITIFVQEGRFRQLVIKSCLALLIGWHVMALLFTFIFLSLLKEIIQVRRTKISNDSFNWAALSQYFVLGFVALGISILIFIYNIGNEYYALNIRELSRFGLSDLPSFRSILYRTGLSQEVASGKALDVSFFKDQFARIGLMSVPFGWSGLSSSYSSAIWKVFEERDFYIGIVVVGICIVGIFLVRHRLLVMTAVFAGFVWAIPMYRNVIQHEYDALFYVGIPLCFYSLVLLLIQKYLPGRFMPLVSVSALSVFVFSSYRIGYTDRNDREVEFHRSVVKDFDVIRKYTGGKNIFIPVIDRSEEIVELIGARYGFHYYLSGNRIIFRDSVCNGAADMVDFMIQTRWDDIPGLLTPENQKFFLYNGEMYEEYIDKLIGQGPAVRGDFNVYLTDDRKLVYVSDRCYRSDLESVFLHAPILVTIYPVATGDSADSALVYEFTSFDLTEYLMIDTKRHVAIYDLPDYDIASISTEQYTEEGRIWSGSFFGPEHRVDVDLSQLADQTVASRKPVIRDRFDVYLTDDRNLMYLRESCDNGDISDMFFVHVIPVDFKDLPEHRRQYAFDNLDFVFVDHGTKDAQRCAAVIELPDYDIVSIRTGQYTNQGQVWQNEFGLDDG